MLLPFRSLDFYGDKTSVLGEGAYGKVYLTTNNYAIKQIVHNGDSIHPSALSEIVSLLNIKSPYVIPLIDVSLGETFTTLVLPAANKSLYDVINHPYLNVKSLMRDFCLGLADIHNSGILHLDLKPQNLLLTNIENSLDPTSYTAAKLWIADFGISKINTFAYPPLEETFFTLWYRSPENLLGGPITDKADVWAFGSILAELLISQRDETRKVLFTGNTRGEQIDLILRFFGTSKNGALTKLPKWSSNFSSYRNVPISKFLDLGLSHEEANLLVYILNPDYTQRPSIFEVLHHPWFGFDLGTIPERIAPLDLMRQKAAYPENKWRHFKRRKNIITLLDNLVSSFNLGQEVYSLSIYLLDKVISLRTIRKSIIKRYAVTCLFLSANFYGSYWEISQYLRARKKLRSFTIEQIQETIDDILILTNFDLAPATSYLFVSHVFLNFPDLLRAGKDIWQDTPLTLSYFAPPEKVADAIMNITLAALDEPFSVEEDKFCETLLEEVMDLYK